MCRFRYVELCSYTRILLASSIELPYRVLNPGVAITSRHHNHSTSSCKCYWLALRPQKGKLDIAPGRRGTSPSSNSFRNAMSFCLTTCSAKAFWPSLGSRLGHPIVSKYIFSMPRAVPSALRLYSSHTGGFHMVFTCRKRNDRFNRHGAKDSA